MSTGTDSEPVAGVYQAIVRSLYGDQALDGMAERGARARRREELQDRAKTVQEVAIAVGISLLMLQAVVLGFLLLWKLAGL